MEGARIAVTGSRRGEQLALALERRGALVLRGATLSGDVPAPDGAILADTATILDADPDWLVATTGVGMRVWAEAAERGGVTDDLRRLVAGTRCVARGAKAVGGLVPLGGRPEWTSPNNTDHDVAAWLRPRVRPGQTVVVQLHGAPSSTYDVLSGWGVDLLTVVPYRWELPADRAPAHAVIRAAIGGELDVITFTSAGAVRNLFVLARDLGGDVEAALRQALAGGVAVAAVGPVTAEAVEESGGIVTVVPRRWRTGDLVDAVDSWWERRGDAGIGLRLDPARSCVGVAGREVDLGPREYAVLAALARRAGVMVRTEELVTEAWGHAAPADATAVKHQVARLRRKLAGDGVVIETVRGVGYRMRVG